MRRIGALTLCFLLACRLIGSTETRSEEPDHQAVQSLVEKLSSARFRTRQEAAEKLWELGPAIEPLLIELRGSADFETSQRIQEIRRRFEIGITPDIPPQIRRLIMQAVDGNNDKRRREVTTTLARGGHYDAVLAVLKRLPGGGVRRGYYSLVIGAIRQAKPSEELEQLHAEMLELAINDPDPRESQYMISTVLQSSHLRTHKNSGNWIEKIIQLASDCPGDTERRRLIDPIYFYHSSTSTELFEKGVIAKWINLVAVDPERAIRGRHISKLFNASMLASSTYSRNIKIEKLYSDLTPAGQNALIDVISQSPVSLEMLHERIGDDAILKGCGKTTDAKIRGNLVGKVVALKSWPQQPKGQQALLDLLAKENDPSAKQEMVVGFLQGLGNPRAAASATKVPQDTADAIWKLIAEDELQVWQLRALVQTYGSKQTFGSHHDAETLQRMFKLVALADKTDAAAFASAPIANQYLSEQLGKHKLSIEFLRSLADLPEAYQMGGRLASLISSSRFTNSFGDARERKLLLDFYRRKLDARSKAYAVSGLTRNKTLLTHLLDECGYDAVKTAVLEGLPEGTQDSVWGGLVSSEPVVAYLSKAGKVDELLKFKGADKKVLAVILRPIVASDAAVAAIIDSDQFDALVDAIEQVEDEYSNRDLKRQLMSRSGFAKRLAQKGLIGISLKEFQGDQDWLRNRIYEKLIINLDRADAAGEPTLAVTFWNFATGLEADYARRECISKLLSSPWFLPQLSEQDKLNVVTDSIGKTLEKNDLRSLLQTWMRTENVMFFMHQDHVNSLLKLCEALGEKEQRDLYRYLGQASNMRTWFSGKGQPDVLIKVISGIKDDKRRAMFGESILASGMLSGQRQNGQLAPKLIAYANRQPKPFAARLAVVLMSQYEINKPVMSSNLPQLVIDELDRADLETDLIKQLLQSSPISSLLAKQNAGRKVVDRVLALADPQQRFDCLQLIAQNYYLQGVLRDHEMKSWFDEYLKRAESQSLSNLHFQMTATVERLIGLGYFDAMKRMVDAQDAKENTVSHLRMAFYTHTGVIKQLRARNQSADVLHEIIDQAPAVYRTSHLSRLLSNREAMKWMLETSGWKRLNQQFQLMRPSDRIRYLPRMIRDPVLAEYLVKHQEFGKLLEHPETRAALSSNHRYLELIRAPNAAAILNSKPFRDFLVKSIDEDKDVSRRRSICSALSYSRCYPALLKHGHGDWLLETLERLGADDLADPNSRYHLDASNRLLTIAIEADRLDIAQRLLEGFLSTDQARIRLATFLLIRGTLEEYLEKLAALPDPATDQQRVDRRRLQFFLLRAAGRLDEAEAIARQLDDALAWSLAMERHRWDRARDLPVCEVSELPDSNIKKNINPIHRKVEQLGFSIAFDRLTGRDAEAEKSTEELIKWIDLNSGDLNNVRYGTDALLMNGRPEQSLQLLDQHLPLRAFYWHWERLEFDQALQQIGWSAEQADQCFDRFSNGANGDHARRTAGVNYMLQVAKMLRLIERQEDVSMLLDALVRHPELKQIDAKQGQNYLRQLSKRLYEEGFRDRSRMLAAKLIEQRSMLPELYFTYLYSSRANVIGRSEATIWWNELETRFSDETIRERLARLDGAMTATTPIEELRPLPTKILDGKELVSVPVTCFRYGLVDETRKILNQYEPFGVWDHALISGRIYLAEQNYEAAANAFQWAWELRRTDLTRLYLAGQCWEMAGDGDTGRRQKQRAMLVLAMMSSGHLHHAAIGLSNEGRPQEAAEVARLVMRTAAPASQAYIEALDKVYMQTDDASQRLQLWRENCLYHLRPTRFYRWVPGWIRSITRHHVLQAIAAMEQGDFAAVESAWQDAKNINEGYMWIAHWIVPELRKCDQHKLADKIFQAHEAYLTAKIKDYPESGVLKERLTTLREICAAE